MNITGKEALNEILVTLGDASRDVVNTYINDEVEAALAIERDRESKRVTKVLYELELSDDDIVRLLIDNWRIEKRKAISILQVEKTVNVPIKKLIKCLREDGWKNSSVQEFMKENNVKMKLENDPSLWKLSPQELKAKVDGGNNER